MLKKSDNNNNSNTNNNDGKKERPYIKPPELRPRPPRTAESPKGQRTERKPEGGGRPPRSGGIRVPRRQSLPPVGAVSRSSAAKLGSGDHSLGGARATASKFGNGGYMTRDDGTNGNGTNSGGPAEKTNPEAVRFVPLGGLEEVGRNCMFLEYKNEIVIIDVGLQFPEDETPGIDYIIPNIQYLEKKRGQYCRDHPDARPLRPHRRTPALARQARQSSDLRNLYHKGNHRKTPG